MAISSLDQVAVNRLPFAQQAALMRLQLYLTGRTHDLLSGFAGQAREILGRNAGEDGQLDGVEFINARQQLEAAWKKTFVAWQALFEALRVEAASIPFGTLAEINNRLIAPLVKAEMTEDRKIIGGTVVNITRSDYVFDPQLQAILDAAKRRLYGDGLQLSSRLWKLDQDTQDGIRRVLYAGIANKRSAWDIAKELEKYLGAGAGCPRWTRTRLYKLTKKDIASGDRSGLITGAECEGKGVAYNALRLARNEIQIAHHLATDELAAANPLIEQEKIMLSPAHPKPDICDQAAYGGQNGDGVYPKGTISLPLHPQCLCFKTYVTLPDEQFAAQLRGWMRREQSWPQMDTFAQRFEGVLGQVIAGKIIESLSVWLFAGESDLDARSGWGMDLGGLTP